MSCLALALLGHIAGLPASDSAHGRLAYKSGHEGSLRAGRALLAENMLASAQGKRYSLANSRIMIHQPLGGAQGQAAGAPAAAPLLPPWLRHNSGDASMAGQAFRAVVVRVSVIGFYVSRAL